jgi:hypothetical protein
VLADKKKAYVILSSPKAIEKDITQLITDQPSCIEMFQNHFEKVWSEAIIYRKECSKSPCVITAKNRLPK